MDSQGPTVPGHLGDADQRFGRVVDLTRELTDSSSDAELLQVMITAASADGGYLALRGADGELDLAACDRGPSYVDPAAIAHRLRSQAPESSASTSVSAGRGVWVSTRAEGEQRFPEVTEMVPWVQAWVALPLVTRSELVGIIVLGFAGEIEFIDPDRRTLESMAMLCSVAVSSARMHLRSSSGRSSRHPKT